MSPPTNNTDDRAVERLELRVNLLERQQAETSSKIDGLSERFSRHEDHVLDRLEKGNALMRTITNNISSVTASFETFTSWFKWTVVLLVTVLLGILGLLIRLYL